MVGSALSMAEDLIGARITFGDVPVVAINGASREIKADFLYSHHADRLGRWVRNQARLFGPGFTVHSRNRQEYGALPCVDHWWDVPAGGGSAWEARKVAASMGFELVVLCGCPLLAGPYQGHKLDGLLHDDDVAQSLFAQIEADVDWHAGCISMSGRTRELLGCSP